MLRVLYIEPFDAGSHAEFTRAVTTGIEARWTVLSLPGRHWKWRMRGAAVHFSLSHADTLSKPYDVVLASAFLPLAELRGLVPALSTIPTVLYFHENQLAYPVQHEAADGRDHHYGFTQLVSALAADRCAFNSEYNRQSFLDAGRTLLQRMPDAVPQNWIERLETRSVVTGYPLRLGASGEVTDDLPGEPRALGPVLLWNHRWEHDKAPEVFFSALARLQARGVPFRVAVAGERFRTSPAIFEQAHKSLGSRVVHWGYLPSREAYEALLRRSHLAVSTARQEFFGVSTLEAVAHGARPLVPDRLAYRELYPAALRYQDDELASALEQLCRAWVRGEITLREERPTLIDPQEAPRCLARLHTLLRDLADPPA
ncbi:MAG: DUF3524 domain-containing protein [Pseudomonadota bacterium]